MIAEPLNPITIGAMPQDHLQSISDSTPKVILNIFTAIGCRVENRRNTELVSNFGDSGVSDFNLLVVQRKTIYAIFSMNQRSIPCPLMHPMEQSPTQVQPLKVTEHAAQVPYIGSMHPASLNLVEPCPIYRENSNNTAIRRSPYNTFQNYHAVPNIITAPSNYYSSPYMFSQNNSYSTQANELGMHNQYHDNIREFGKRMSGFCETATSSSQSSSVLSSSSGLLPDPANTEQSVLRVRENIQITDGSGRSVMNQSSIVPPPQRVPHFNYMMQVNHMDQPLHPHAISNGWMTQFGSENNVGSRQCSNWNCSPLPYLNGGLELANMGIQSFPGNSSSSSTPVIFDPPTLPHFHRVQNYGHHVQMQANTYQHPFNIAHSTNGYPIAEQIYRPRVIPHLIPSFIHGGVRILSQEDAAMMDISGLHGVENYIDQHQDMRLDIDEMSYEELLALEERIGYVKTGLTEEYIMKNLRKSICSSGRKCRADSGFLQETEACIICQVEYEEDETIGTLDCGHNYHGECIKQWLLVKNLCPICKKTALGTNTSEK